MIRLSPTAVLYPGDCIETMKSLPDNSIDSVVCDPPYHLTSIVKRFGGANAAPAQYGTDGAFARASRGFMQKNWDGGDVAFQPSTWAEVLRVLKPGGYCAAFGAPRNFGRLQVAMFEAGFEERDTILNDLDPASPVAMFLDSLNDAQRDAFMKCFQQADIAGMLAWKFGVGFPKSKSMRDIGRPELGTSLKPAFEPIVLARKPLSEGTVAANVLRWGTGALNIDGCRVAGEPWSFKHSAKTSRSSGIMGDVNGSRQGVAQSNALGRWPANVVHDGSDEVVGAFPNSAGQQGDLKTTGRARPAKTCFGDMAAPLSHPARNDSGSAARFFKSCPPDETDRRFHYSAKASKADRNGSKHPTVKPIALMQWLARLITPPGGTVLDPFAGSGTTGAACEREGFSVILCEREDEYVADIRRRLGADPLARLLRWNAAVASYRSKVAA